MANGIELATAYVSLAVSAQDVGPQTRKVFSGMERDADTSGKRAGKKFSSGMSGTFKGIAGAFAGVMAGVAVGNFLGDALGEARESQKVGAITANVIKQTGGAAKITEGQVSDLAAAISKKAGVDDEAIQTGANLLLTFKNVRNEAGKGGDVFNRATQAAVDLSAAGFGSVDGAAKMLGKALNDPLKGISALGRAGVTFTEGQKKQIKEMVKVGDTLGAQQIIMREVESQVGGAAAASATAGDKLKVSWGNLKETVGTALLPIIDRLAKFLTDKVIPAFEDFFAILINNDTDIDTSVATPMQRFGLVVLKVGHWVKDSFIPTVKSLWGWLKNNLWPALKDAYETILPGVKKAFDIVTGGGNGKGGVEGAKSGFKKFGEILTDKVIPFIAVLISHWLPVVATNIKSLIETIKLAWQAFEKWRDIAVPAILFIVRKFLDMVGIVVNGAAKAFGWMPGIGPKLKKAAGEFNKFKDSVNRALDGINDKKVSVGVKFVAGTRVVMGSTSSGGGRNTMGGSTDFAAGGVLPGYTPGRDVHEFYSPTAGRLNPSGGEAIMRPEFTRLVGGKAGVDALNANARKGALGFASGGVFARIPSGRGIREGVDSATLDVVAKSAKMLQAAAQSMAGGPGMGWRAMVAWAKANIPGAAVTSTVRRGNPASDHYRGRAIDLAGGPGMSRIFDRISGAFPTSSVRSLYYSPKGGNQIRFNRRSNTPPHIYSTHFDHVHWAMANGGVIPRIKPTLYDQGGVLKPGTTLVQNNTGQDEYITPPRESGRGGQTIQLVLDNGKVLAELVMDEMGNVLTGGRTVLVQ